MIKRLSSRRFFIYRVWDSRTDYMCGDCFGEHWYGEFEDAMLMTLATARSVCRELNTEARRFNDHTRYGYAERRA